MAAEPVLQSSLGSVVSSSTKADRSWSTPQLQLGVVTKVYLKRYTAEVSLIGSSTTNVISSTDKNEGKYACKIGVVNAGYDTKLKKPYGQIIPIEPGTIVLVARINNNLNQAVIVKTFHSIDEAIGEDSTKNILQNSYLPMTKISDADSYRYTNITRTQDFFTVDGFGNFDVASHSKSFITGRTSEMDEDNFDYSDLSVRDNSGETIGMSEDYSGRMNFLAVFASKFSEVGNSIRLFISAKKNLLKFFQTVGNTAAVFEFMADGSISIRKHIDTNSSTRSESSNYSEVLIDSSGEITVKAKKNTITLDSDGCTIDSSKNTITLNSNGCTITSSSKMNIKSSGDINLTPTGGWVKISGKNVVVSGDPTSDGATVYHN